MYDYEAHYVRIRASGLPAWQGSEFPRAFQRITAKLGELSRDGHLPRPPARALEIGCGNGVIATLLAARGYDVCGIDISPTAIEWAKQRFTDAGLSGSFHVGNVCDLSCFARASFDVVFDGQCLHCLIGDDRRACLREVRRIMSSNAVFIVSTMCGAPKSDDARANFDARSGLLYRDGVPYRTLKPLPDLLGELTAAGFVTTEAGVNANDWWDHATLACQVVPRPARDGTA